MTAGDPNPNRRRRIALAVILVTGLLPILQHLHFILVDQRMPRDLGNFYNDLPDFWRQLHGQQARFGPDGPPQPWDSGVWYEWLLALWLSITGPGGPAFRVFDLVWQSAILLFVGMGAAALVRLVDRPREPDNGSDTEARALTAAAFALVLTGSMRSLVVMPRLSWIHVVELALLFGAAVPWLRDPTLRRGFLPTALLGALVLLLRSSGLPWIAPLALAILVGVGGRRPDLPRLAFIGTAWFLAALPSLIGIVDYLGPKLNSRARYAQNVAPFTEQVLDLAGPFAPVAALAGVLLAGRKLLGVPQGLLLIWALSPLALWAIFRAGMDNFLVGFAAFAILASLGLARRPAIGAVLVLPGWLLITLPRVLPAPAPESTAARLLQRAHLSVRPTLRDVYVPFTEWGHPQLEALLDATCPQTGTCVLAVDQGLLVPYSEDAGTLETFLLGRGNGLDLLDLRSGRHGQTGTRVNALITYDCGWQDQPWRQRFPNSLERLQMTIKSQRLRTAWMATVGGECIVHWLTPGGRVPRAELLPSNWDPPVGSVPTYEAPRGANRPRPVRTGE